MREFLLVIGIAVLASFLTCLGALAAEWLDVPRRVVSGALQFAAGIIVALVALSLMPPAVRTGPPMTVALTFFSGGAAFVFFDYFSARRLAAKSRLDTHSDVKSIGLYAGILADLVIDGVLIGVGSTVTLGTGLQLALGLAISTAPLAFVTTATAKRQGVSEQHRRMLSMLIFLCILAGAILGFVLVRDQPETVKVVLVGMASGFLITTVSQSMIPEANRGGEPSLAGILFVAGMSLYGMLSLAAK